MHRERLGGRREGTTRADRTQDCFNFGRRNSLAWGLYRKIPCTDFLVMMAAIHVVAKKYQSLGKTAHLTHRSQEYRKMIRQAQDLISFSLSDEPQYHLTTDKFSRPPETSSNSR